MAQRKKQDTRAWEDWLGIAAGLAIAFAPWIVDETGNRNAVVNAALSGAVVLLLAEFELVRFRRWPEIGLTAAGVWVAVSPMIFNYAGSGQLRAWHAAAGLIVACLGLMELRQARTP